MRQSEKTALSATSIAILFLLAAATIPAESQTVPTHEDIDNTREAITACENKDHSDRPRCFGAIDRSIVFHLHARFRLCSEPIPIQRFSTALQCYKDGAATYYYYLELYAHVGPLERRPLEEHLVEVKQRLKMHRWWSEKPEGPKFL